MHVEQLVSQVLACGLWHNYRTVFVVAPVIIAMGCLNEFGIRGIHERIRAWTEKDWTNDRDKGYLGPLSSSTFLAASLTTATYDDVVGTIRAQRVLGWCQVRALP